MKRFFIFAVLVIFSFFLYTQSASAQVLRSFGGKITSTTIPSIVCPGAYGPASILPAGLFPALPYATTLSTAGSLKPGSWVLGLYNPVPTPGLCYSTATVVPTPFPTFNVIKYGTSRGFGF